jgi:hypothetical protein
MKTFVFILMALIVTFPVALHAQSVGVKRAATVSVQAKQSEVKADIKAETPADKIKNEPLSVRKQRVETQLRDILAQLILIHTRTQLAVDRLTEKDMDTLRAQEQLTLANTYLTEAKLNIDAFSKIAVIDDKTDKVLTATLRDAVKKSEDSLKATRDALIQSLAHLKATLIISTSTSTEY